MKSPPAALPRAGELATELRPAERIAAAWLIEYRGHTRAAYVRDLAAWSAFCAERGVDLMLATRAMVAAYADQLQDAGLGAATINRKLSALTGFYRRGVELGQTPNNPAEFVRRPRVSQEGFTPGLDRDELRRMLKAAEVDSARSFALVSLLSLNALCVSEAVGANAHDLSNERGHRTLTLTQTGGGRVRVPIAPSTAAALQAYLAGRETGALFLAHDDVAERRTEDPRSGPELDLEPATARRAVIALEPLRAEANPSAWHPAGPQNASQRADPEPLERFRRLADRATRRQTRRREEAHRRTQPPRSCDHGRAGCRRELPRRPGLRPPGRPQNHPPVRQRPRQPRPQLHLPTRHLARRITAPMFCSTIPWWRSCDRRSATVFMMKMSNMPCETRCSWKRSTRIRRATSFSVPAGTATCLSWLCSTGPRAQPCCMQWS